MNRKSVYLLTLFAYTALVCVFFASPAAAERSQALIDRTIHLPTWGEALDVALLRNYNTRLVALSSMLLGLASGLIGGFLLLRKRSLMGDTLSHACLPGIALAFIVMHGMGLSGKALPGLLLGATLSGMTGVGLVMAIRSTTRVKDDAAMGIVLSVFFGLGVVLLSLASDLPGANAAGLEGFILGKTASMVAADFYLIISVAIAATVASLLLRKELTLLCFDSGYAAAQGWSVFALDALLMSLVTAVTVVGLQAVGLILIIAFLIIPAAAARFWTHRIRRMLALSGLLGALSGWLGASLSALLPKLPAGAVIVLVATAIFVVSLLVGPARGVLPRVFAHWRLIRKIRRQHLLRSVYEILERSRPDSKTPTENGPVTLAELRAKRSWTPAQLRSAINAAWRHQKIESFDGERLLLTEPGFGEAMWITRNHRLWEMYLIAHADVAPAHVDRDADMVEHVLSPDMVRELETELRRRGGAPIVPPNPHEALRGEPT